MRYAGKLYFPAHAELTLDLAELSPIQGKLAFDVYGQLKARMTHDKFGLQVDASPTYEPVTMEFQRFGQTAATVKFVPPGAGADGGDLWAAMAILPRLDRVDDTGALASLLTDKRLNSVIAEDDFESAHRHSSPLVAAFFTSETSLNGPLLHGLMSLVGAAFFDRLGLLEEE